MGAMNRLFGEPIEDEYYKDRSFINAEREQQERELWQFIADEKEMLNVSAEIELSDELSVPLYAKRETQLQPQPAF